MLGASAAAGAAVALVWTVTPDLATTLLLFSVAGFLAAMRLVSATVYGFDVSGEHSAAVGGIRAATSQLGYFVGSLAGGIALAVGGFDGLALTYGGLFVAAVVPFLCLSRTCRAQRVLFSAEA